MNIQTKALIQTGKSLGIGALVTILTYNFIMFVGLKIGISVLLVVFVAWMAYILYDMNLRRLKWEEDSNKTIS